MNKELKESNMNKITVLKTVINLVVTSIVAIGVCYGIYLQKINDLENLKANDAKQDVIITHLTDQINKGILENGITASELKNSKEDIKEIKELTKEILLQLRK